MYSVSLADLFSPLFAPAKRTIMMADRIISSDKMMNVSNSKSLCLSCYLDPEHISCLPLIFWFCFVLIAVTDIDHL